MNILDKIFKYKKKETAERKSLFPTRLLEKSIYFDAPTVSLKKYLLRTDKSGIIAEIKRKSPGAGIINQFVNVERTSIGYMQAGASALSILTDEHFFGGSSSDLTIARKFNFCPILRKDFILDEYQIVESKSIGADAILLIAAILSPVEIASFSSLARTLGLEVVLEIRQDSELIKVGNEVDIIGVNNRNLNNFKTDLKSSLDMSGRIPKGCPKISESGIRDMSDVKQLKKAGYNGFLIGELFMRSARPEKICADFIRQIHESRN